MKRSRPISIAALAITTSLITAPIVTAEEATSASTSGTSATNQSGASKATSQASASTPTTTGTSVATQAQEEYYEVAAKQDPKAIAYVQKNVTSGGTLKIHGTGWLTNGKGSNVTVKLLLGDGKYAARTEAPFYQHPESHKEDKTIWALIPANADGSFEKELDLPKDLEKGQRLQVSITTGFNGEPQRAVSTDSLFVDGEQWIKPDTGAVKCVPSVDHASMTTEVDQDKRILIIHGKGFCNEKNGGSVVAFKIGPKGDYSRLDDSKKISDNLTVWGVAKDEVDPHTGDFEYHLQLPDGTTEKPNGSKPAFGEGTYTLVALTGSIKDDDPIRSVKAQFTFGKYHPENGAPKTPHYSDDLTKENMGGVSAELKGNELTVTVPNGKEGDWVYITDYLPDQTLRDPWDQWYQLDKNKQVVLPKEGKKDKIQDAGKHKIVVQSGNSGETGKVVGWAWLNVKDDSKTDNAQDSSTDGGSNDQDSGNSSNSGVNVVPAETEAQDSANSDEKLKSTGSQERSAANDEEVVIVREDRTSSGGGSRSRRGSSSSGSPKIQQAETSSKKSKKKKGSAKPGFDPKAPVSNKNGLTKENAGNIKGSAKGEVLNIKVPDAKEGDWFYIWAYTPKAKAVGWTQTNDKSTMSLNISELPDGKHKFAVLNSKGDMIGWVGLTLASKQESTTGTGETMAQSAKSSGMQMADWAWILGSLAALMVLGIATFFVTKRR